MVVPAGGSKRKRVRIKVTFMSGKQMKLIEPFLASSDKPTRSSEDAVLNAILLFKVHILHSNAILKAVLNAVLQLIHTAHERSSDAVLRSIRTAH